LVCLSASPKYFPDCSKDESARKLKISATQADSIHIAGVKPGTYAVALVHDENANGKMDMRLFLPREGFGFSRNPKIGMGPPKFKSAQFTVGADDTHYAVRMNYIYNPAEINRSLLFWRHFVVIAALCQSENGHYTGDGTVGPSVRLTVA